MFARALSARAGLAAAQAVFRPCTVSRMSPLRAKVLVSEQGQRSLVCHMALLFLLLALSLPLPSSPIYIASADKPLQSSLSSSAEIWKPLPGDEPEDVVFTSLYGLRTIELNRPKKLNSLSGSMIRKIGPRLIEWQNSDLANVIVMKGAGKALCAGGDVASLAKAIETDGEAGQKLADDYFALEYKLDHLIATYRKPYISFMDGFTMGGGVGLSIHAPFRIATERTVFSMPETTIGFFPDVGASFFLKQMPGAVGTYLALTSEQLKGPNVFYAGIATHYLHSTTLPLLESRLAELRFRDFDSMEKRLHLINDTIEEYTTGLPHDQPILIRGHLRRVIDRCFSKGSVEEIIQALKKERGPLKGWAAQTVDTLHARSPTSLQVTLRQMQGKRWSIAETFKREHQLAAKFMRHPDFVEGVNAQLIRKDKAPKWQPATLGEISNWSEVTDPFFEISSDVEPLELLTNDDYNLYHYPQFGLPTEEEVEQVSEESIEVAVKGPNGKKVLEPTQLTAAQVADAFVAQRNDKQGVREVVEEILARKTKYKEARKGVDRKEKKGTSVL